MFKPVSSQVDFPTLEKELLSFWYEKGIVEKYLRKNEKAKKKFSFLDGPITANNPMGVHHAWGRTYKDLFQRFFNMKGFKERFQNGFDEQGLWVEVEVEKELGLKNKKEIENLISGDKFKSLEKFVNLCKERVKKYSLIQTEQSKRLGYFMNWDNSYHTSSDNNNYSIWHFLKVIFEKGWLYKGRDSVPWCPRCGTAISQHEILTESYQLITHTSVYIKLPVIGKKGVYLLVWTTTPWTIPANVAVAVDPTLAYLEIEDKGESYIITENIANLIPEGHKVKEYKGEDLINWQYQAPFDDLPEVKKDLAGYQHKVIASDPVILPISTEEGTGLVHVAPGAGAEDHALGKKYDLPVIDPIDESGVYLPGFGKFSGLSAKEVSKEVINEIQKTGFLYQTVEYPHRYPVCWRCKTELLWRVVDEWYIAMDKTDESKKTYRQQMMEIIKNINWLPKWGYERELDWLKNMHDWLISKKRYWGLALPIWECEKCHTFAVIGSQEELKEKAIAGWEEFVGHSPHRPWIDQVKIKCPKCGGLASRIPDVGNPWLDAGIVPFSTLPEDWFPADFVTESFPGQFKNWFYSLIAMSTALKNEPPVKNLLGFSTMVDEKGQPFHKSAGNSIEFVEGADSAGADIIRWMCVTQNPEDNLLFGYHNSGEIKRRFYLILWNSYKFFVDYANLVDWDCSRTPSDIKEKLTALDSWILARLTEVVLLTNRRLEKYDSLTPSRAIEDFVVNDFSTWYIRRSRDRVGPGALKEDEKIFLSVAFGVLVTLSKLLAPFLPFISEMIFQNLTGGLSVHLEDYPKGDESLLNKDLVENMNKLRKLAEIGLAQRKEAGIKLRQPLLKFTYESDQLLNPNLEKILGEELNVKEIEYKNNPNAEIKGMMNTNITPKLQAEGETREIIRQIQTLRREKGLTLKDQVKVSLPQIPQEEDLKKMILSQTNSTELSLGEKLTIEVVR